MSRPQDDGCVLPALKWAVFIAVGWVLASGIEDHRLRLENIEHHLRLERPETDLTRLIQFFGGDPRKTTNP